MFEKAILLTASLIALNVNMIRAQSVLFAAENWDYDKASKLCISQGSVVSGIQNLAESTFVIDSSYSVMGGNSGSIWLGAERTKQCLKKKLSATCSQKTAFSWTDGSTTGDFNWLDSSQPDNAHGLTQDCLVFFAAGNNVKYKNVDWFPGALDDVACSTAQMEKTGPRVVRAVLCGQAAK
uniref:C-type lectin domain-containing protein n=1 Tax=Caenorhabditis japonica TaxID=281687 RepID=A0A8R1DSU6_CAEJA